MKKYLLILISILILSHVNGQGLDERYHSVVEINTLLDSLDQLEELNGWFRVDTIGFSTQDQIPILAVKISDNVDLKEDEPQVLFIGQVHAEEVLGVEVVLDLMEDLLFPDNSIYSHMNILKQFMEIWIVPTANPEGLNVIHDGLDMSFRKNKKDLSPEGPYPNGIFDYESTIGNDIDGVDLNRNFDFNWTFGDTFLEPDNSDYASHYDYYKGEEPFSEGEAIALRDLALENDFVFSIVWHSSRSGNLSEKVFTSWRWEETKDSPDLNLMKTVADQFADLLETEDGTGSYLSVYSGSRNGKLHDWFYKETGCIQYLVECGTANLQPDSILIEDTIDRTKPAMVYLMDRALGYNVDAAQVTGIVYDASTNQPIEDAIIEILENTGSVLKPRLTNEFGRYRRILGPGSYTISIRAEGYLPQEISTVTNNSAITTEDIFLQPAPAHEVKIYLTHDTMDINTVGGTIQTEFGETYIQITTGENIFYLLSGVYQITFPMDGQFMPWNQIIAIESDMSLTVPYWTGNGQILSQSWPWENSEGPWQAGNVILRSQESILYDNGDSTFLVQWMESDLVDISGMNRAVVAVTHKFETEWDHDPVTVTLLDENDNILGTKSWTGDRWGDYQTDLVTAIAETEFSQVKVRLEFSPDGTVNYRGWELQSLTLFSILDEYLDIVESSGTISPKIPMTITGIYPNPSHGRFQLDIANYPGGNGNIRIFNILGQEIKSFNLQKLSAGRHYFDLNLNNINGRPMSSGMVFVRVESGNEQLVKKFIILKK
jgi:hypothetical protein